MVQICRMHTGVDIISIRHTHTHTSHRTGTHLHPSKQTPNDTHTETHTRISVQSLGYLFSITFQLDMFEAAPVRRYIEGKQERAREGERWGERERERAREKERERERAELNKSVAANRNLLHQD